MLKKLILFTTIFSMVVGLSTAGASPYMVYDLGQGIGYGINDWGNVTGISYDSATYGPAVWVDGAMTSLPGAYKGMPMDINNAGVVVGNDGFGKGIVWYPPYGSDNMVYLRGVEEHSGNYAPCGVQSISNGGFVIGHSFTKWNYMRDWWDEMHATIWDPDGVPRDLGALPGSSESLGFGINDAVHVVGESDAKVFYGIIDIIAMPLLPSGSSAYDINNADQFVGHYRFNGSYVAYRSSVLPLGGGLKLLGDSSWAGSFGQSLNDAGEVVGPSPRGAFVWNAWDGMRQLDQLIHEDDPLYGKVTLNGARAINNHGLIVANGHYIDDTVRHVFVLRPINLSAAYLTTGSPVSISQVVNTPQTAFDMKFDYRFETTTGVLTVWLDSDHLVTIPAPTTLSPMQTETITIDVPHLDLSNVEFEFELDGADGSTVVLDNIIFPGVENGRFASGDFFGWTTEVSGAGSLVIEAPPEVPEGLLATIDIDPNVLNLKSKGRWITTYIELPEGYGVTDIDQATVAITDVGGEAANIPAEWKPVTIGDHDLDGIADLSIKFLRADVTEIVTDNGDADIEVSGKLLDGTAFSSIDRIHVIH